jgi:DNA-binding winged helix-turn-helix (wHTH) protein
MSKECELCRLRAENAALRDALSSLESPRPSIPRAFGLGRYTGALLELLMKRELVTKDSAFTFLYGQRSKSVHDSLMGVNISQLRKKLKECGIAIQTSYGEGWFIRSDDKKRLQSLFDKMGAA